MGRERVTEMGTPCSGKWSDEWIAHVEYVEGQLGRRICGCHTMAGTPCKLSPATLTGHAGSGESSPDGGRAARPTTPLDATTHSSSFDADAPDPAEGGPYRPAGPSPEEKVEEEVHAGEAVGNGRCRFHGGVVGIGAPLGNRNAVVHGLYARRIQRCGIHCGLWQHCPMSGKDVLALDPKERPHCVYERDEYRTLTSLLRPAADDKPKAAPNPHPPGSPQYWAHRKAEERNQKPQPESSTSSHPQGTPAHTRSQLAGCDANASDPATDFSLPTFSFSKEKVEAGTPLLHHNIAMYQVMLTRAQAALGIAELVDESRADGDKYSMRSSKVSSLLQAQLRIGRELRQWIRMLANVDIRAALGLASADKSGDDEDDVPSLAEYMQPIIEQAEDVIEDAIARARKRPNTDARGLFDDDPDPAPA